ncbi:hypothetical protein CRM22_010247 [Opisthorchis felineus]|uniref:Neurotransmitter-gated ion-channel ligand-binding domain-containing protein n=1 Tax=Opisthorchis felineus TaxID=147828 RepID=A0A4S2L5Y2_OPIFE|nr:hypothetical protein CRM22_010247 [Opisthorchis felineus]
MPAARGILIFILCSLPFLKEGFCKVEPTAEKALIRTLLDRYKRYGVIGRPVNDSRIRMVVQYGLQMIQILGLDENKQVLRSNCWTVYRWNDALLQWNTSQYDNITVLRIVPQQIWTPDIKLHNFADERLQEYREGGLLVHSNGDILWLQQALFKSTCQVEITYFPFDSQVCMLEFGSLTYDKSLLELEWWTPDDSETPMPYVDFSDYIPANEWYTDGEDERHLKHEQRTKQIRSIKRYRVQYTTNNKKEALYFPVLRFRVRLYRNPSFHMFILIIPCLLLSLLTLVVFWLPPDSPAKMMLGINIFVAFFVLLLLLAKSMSSAVKDFPLIGVFFCLNMVLVTLSQFLATMVVNLFYRGTDGRPPPLWARRMIIDRVGRILHLRQNIPLPPRIPVSIGLEAATTEGNVKIGNGIQGESLKPSLSDHSREGTGVEEYRGETKKANISGQRNGGETNFDRKHGLSLLGELREDLDFLDTRQFKEVQKQLVLMEWHTLAKVVDRVFFILYLIIMLGSISVVLWNYDLMQMVRIFNTRNALKPIE